MCVCSERRGWERVDDDGECLGVWVVAGGSVSVVVSVGRDNWEGLLGCRSERLGWLQVQVWVLARNRVSWFGEQLRNRPRLRSARR